MRSTSTSTRLVEGHNYHSAAAELGVTFSTINFQMQNIYGKLQVHSKSEAATKALRQRQVDPKSHDWQC